VLKEFAIILLVVGCIFLLIPLAWIPLLIPNGGQFALLLWLIPLGVALAYAINHIAKLVKNHEVDKAAAFVFILIVVLVLSLIATFSVAPYVAPRAHQ
jgi:cytochrome bd-type quinol oxidase subunit 2